MDTQKSWKRSLRRPAVWLVVLIVVQSIIYLCAGIGKSYIHMDEAYSLALTHVENFEITENSDFYNTWHTPAYFQQYLAVQEDELGDFSPVYENQKNDVHPPLFYFFLRLAQSFVVGKFSKWPGIILNILIHIGITVLLYAIWRQLLAKEKSAKLKTFVLTSIIAITVASVSSAVYIRMYALLTLMVLLTLWLHLRLISAKTWRPTLMIGIGVTVLLGVLTQYYYLFFLVPLYVVMAVLFLRAKEWKRLGIYTGILAAAGFISLLVWPYSLQHMFFSYRGQGVIHNFMNLPVLLQNIWGYIKVVNYDIFHQIGLVVIILLIVVLWYIVKLRKTAPQKNPVLPLILWPTLVYFLIVSATSPFIELRYIMPVCGLIFGLMMFFVYQLLRCLVTEKTRNLIMLSLIGVTWIAAPVQLLLGQMRIELLYRDRQAVMQETTTHSDAPLLYLISSKNNRFLDNILPFTLAEHSYLALDFDYEDTKALQKILAGQDLSHGLMLWISDQHDHPATLAAVQEALGLREVEYIQTINTCSVYYLY